MLQRLVVKLAVDDLAGERLLIGLSAAGAAAAAGCELVVWLAGEASRLGTAGHRSDPEVAELFAVLQESAQIKICARCAARRGIGEADLLPGVVIAGAASFVADAMREDTRALVY